MDLKYRTGKRNGSYGRRRARGRGGGDSHQSNTRRFKWQWKRWVWWCWGGGGGELYDRRIETRRAAVVFAVEVGGLCRVDDHSQHLPAWVSKCDELTIKNGKLCIKTRKCASKPRNMMLKMSNLSGWSTLIYTL